MSLSLSTEHKPELEEPLISVSLSHYLTEICRSIDGWAAIPRYFAEEFRRVDPLEEHHHIEDYGDINTVKIYPIKVWRESPEKRARDKELSAEGREERFKREAAAKVLVGQIQRKRDIISEVRADLARKYREKGKEIMSELGRGLPTWQQQAEAVDYLIYRLLSGKNEPLRTKLEITTELCLEFQELPVDKDWKNKRFQEELELEKEVGEL